MGFRSIPRHEFREHLARPAEARPAGRWQVEADLETVAAWQPDAKPA